MNLTNSLSKSLSFWNYPSKRTSAFKATRTFMWRTVQNSKNNLMGHFIEAVLSPVIMLLIFGYLFGGAIAGSITAYIQFLLPGVLIITVVPLTVYSGTTICLDITKGVYNRFKTMPFWQPASILGPLITDGIRYIIALLSALFTGIIMGFRPEGGIVGTILAMLFIIFFAFSISWIFATIGVIAKRPETVSGSSMIIIYPLMFASNILVDSATMPRWVQVIVNLNPISIVTTSVRGLMSGTATTAEIAGGIAICMLFIAIFAPLTIYLYLSKGNK
ncbi:MAG: ABC transporter permease, partial [Tetragenococcus koreensis]|uniref:ABC transporter permease n=1 Tax=Tetragenococcus halophilus TaxID=51669 RepID=UPI001F3FE8DD|nr:ABC transporter permease [Tetragenococcus halophilus]MDN6140474.1 ABC transporter permease [Tetragenococcus koreensis]MDN6749774.1 ABC transporter permease [Staphylococcus equorum]MCF1675041.1 ABC transporter permease [Tetragenococcus halophilus]MDN6146902.1 ABC transporter permease [Tetragenococcus koreensis]MDN6166622.1 ABC transporter permease [Tetragenococcus koreensis]